jgi:hypothetical protein
MIYVVVVHLVETVLLSCIKISTISKRTEMSFLLEPRNLRVPSSASKKISERMVHLAQTVHLSCTDTNNISKRTETIFHMIDLS